MRVGILFNDKTKMIMKHSSPTASAEAIYISNSPHTQSDKGEDIMEELDMNKPARNEEMCKKYRLFNQFKAYLLKKQTLIRITSEHKDEDVIYLQNYTRTGVAIVFQLSTSDIQVNFFDNTFIIFSNLNQKKHELITFQDKEGNLKNYGVAEINQMDKQSQVYKKYIYSKAIIKTKLMLQSQEGKADSKHVENYSQNRIAEEDKIQEITKEANKNKEKQSKKMNSGKEIENSSQNDSPIKQQEIVKKSKSMRKISLNQFKQDVQNNSVQKDIQQAQLRRNRLNRNIQSWSNLQSSQVEYNYQIQNNIPLWYQIDQNRELMSELASNYSFNQKKLDFKILNEQMQQYHAKKQKEKIIKRLLKNQESRKKMCPQSSSPASGIEDDAVNEALLQKLNYIIHLQNQRSKQKFIQLASEASGPSRYSSTPKVQLKNKLFGGMIGSEDRLCKIDKNEINKLLKDINESMNESSSSNARDQESLRHRSRGEKNLEHIKMLTQNKKPIKVHRRIIQSSQSDRSLIGNQPKLIKYVINFNN